jgi:hypothetical protein
MALLRSLPEQPVYSAVLVTTLFNFYNRLVDGVGLALPDGYVAEAAKRAFDSRLRRLCSTCEGVTIPSPRLILQNLRHRQGQRADQALLGGSQWSCHQNTRRQSGLKSGPDTANAFPSSSGSSLPAPVLEACFIAQRLLALLASWATFV